MNLTVKLFSASKYAGLTDNVYHVNIDKNIKIFNLNAVKVMVT